MSKRPSSTSSSFSLSKRTFLFQGLHQAMEDPTLLVYTDDKIAIIKDKYPKAKYHFLVLPKEDIINLSALERSEHLDLLKYMLDKSRDYVKKCSLESIEFRYGFHVIPSMSRLHLHVISQDFDSPCLKTKKHWNSFTTRHFIDCSEVIEQLEVNGKFIGMSSIDSKKLLDSSLKCHKCDAELTTMPKLKSHIKSHF